MNPKKKAKELVSKFTIYLGNDINDNEVWTDILEAKLYASLAVEEIMKALDDVLFPNPFSQYWEEVKKEIEKL
jgi:hypothetical protein